MREEAATRRVYSQLLNSSHRTQTRHCSHSEIMILVCTFPKSYMSELVSGHHEHIVPFAQGRRVSRAHTHTHSPGKRSALCHELPPLSALRSGLAMHSERRQNSVPAPQPPCACEASGDRSRLVTPRDCHTAIIPNTLSVMYLPIARDTPGCRVDWRSNHTHTWP